MPSKVQFLIFLWVGSCSTYYLSTLHACLYKLKQCILNFIFKGIVETNNKPLVKPLSVYLSDFPLGWDCFHWFLIVVQHKYTSNLIARQDFEDFSWWIFIFLNLKISFLNMLFLLVGTVLCIKNLLDKLNIDNFNSLN